LTMNTNENKKEKNRIALSPRLLQSVSVALYFSTCPRCYS
jgi:hypothetical protein